MAARTWGEWISARTLLDMDLPIPDQGLLISTVLDLKAFQRYKKRNNWTQHEADPQLPFVVARLSKDFKPMQLGSEVKTTPEEIKNAEMHQQMIKRAVRQHRVNEMVGDDDCKCEHCVRAKAMTAQFLSKGRLGYAQKVRTHPGQSEGGGNERQIGQEESGQDLQQSAQARSEAGDS